MKKRITLFIIMIFIGISPIYAKEKVTFSKCVDGDTIKIKIKDKEYTVRMLAIDTPESVHPSKGIEYYGKEASTYTCDLVTNANKIELEYDENSDKTDKYDRLLAWVFVDNELLQTKLIENGYAKLAYLYGNYKYTSILEEKQELASAKNIGIWDEASKEEYDKKNNITESEASKETNKSSSSTKESTSTEEKYTKTDIIIIIVLLLIIVFVGDKSIKNKAKKKLKTYIK